MHFSDTYELNVSQQQLWQAIIDPFVLQQCIPACQNIIKQGENNYRAEVTVKIAFIKIPFTVELALQDIKENTHYTLLANITDGPAKNTSATSFIEIANIGEASKGKERTQLSYSADTAFNSMLEKISQSIIQHTAKKWLDKFFIRLENIILNGT